LDTLAERTVFLPQVIDVGDLAMKHVDLRLFKMALPILADWQVPPDAHQSLSVCHSDEVLTLPILAGWQTHYPLSLHQACAGLPSHRRVARPCTQSIW
jgi:hypothetical protein